MGEYSNSVTIRVPQSKTEAVLTGDFNSDGREDRLVIKHDVDKHKKAGSYIVSNYTEATIYDGLNYLGTKIIAGHNTRESADKSDEYRSKLKQWSATFNWGINRNGSTRFKLHMTNHGKSKKDGQPTDHSYVIEDSSCLRPHGCVIPD